MQLSLARTPGSVHRFLIERFRLQRVAAAKEWHHQKNEVSTNRYNPVLRVVFTVLLLFNCLGLF